MNYRLPKLLDCNSSGLFLGKKRKKSFDVFGFFNGQMMAQVVAVVSFRRYSTYSEELDCGSNQLFSFICLFGQC